MKKTSFFIINNVISSITGAINLGICTIFLKQAGYNYTSISLIFSVILVSQTIFEYPSGIIADKFGRKKIDALGILLISFQYLFYALNLNIFAMIFAAFCGGVGNALVSGSLEAWLMVEQKDNDVLTRCFSLKTSLGTIFSIFITFTLAFIPSNFAMIYFILGLVMILLAISTFVMFKDNKTNDTEGFIQFNNKAIKEVFSNINYIKIILFCSLAFLFYSIFILYWQVRLEEIGIEKSNIIAVYSLYLIGTAISSYLVPYIKKVLSNRNYLILCIILMTFCFISMRFESIYIASFGLLLFGLGFGSMIPYSYAWMAEQINNDNSATIISFIGSMGTIVSIFANIIIGILMDKFDLNFINAFTILLGVVTLIILISTRNNKYTINKNI